jgi:hypothetical protein
MQEEMTICRKCTPGCKCSHDECMMAYCVSCETLCKCGNEGRSIVRKIDSPLIRNVKYAAASVENWFSNHWLTILGVGGYAAAAYGAFKLMSDFNAEIDSIPHAKAIRLGMAIILLTIAFSRRGK